MLRPVLLLCLLICLPPAFADEGAGAAQTIELRDYNSHCPFSDVPQTAEDWEQRAADLKLQLRVAAGVFPEIDLPAAQPSVYGRVKRDGYTIQRIVFESLPGLKVTGSLYLPAGDLAGKTIPGVLSPHGHWDEARFRVAPDDEFKQALATGAERFEAAARNHIQARAVQLARMGCAVLQWDMIGYCDSQQISRDRIHGFRKQDKSQEMTAEGWLLYSPKAEMNLQSSMGLQVIATQRAVDALLTFDFVDPQRIGITGASGGGTQSFLGAALDQRVAVAFPAVMVSTGMQGGCTCENTSLLRIGTNNVEMAALIAPRPLGMTAANDWTRDMASDGFPQLEQVYALFGAKKNVALFPAVHFGHNFNHVSRVGMYGWMNKHLHLRFDEPVLERDFELTEMEDLTCWDAEHPQPAGGIDFERKLLADWKSRVDNHWRQLKETDETRYQHAIGQGWRVVLGLTAKSIATKPSMVSQSVDGDNAPIVIEVPGARAMTLPGLGLVDQPLVDNPRLAPCYTYGYNLPYFVQQAHRLARVLREIARQDATQGQTVKLSASGVDAALVAAAVFCTELPRSTFELNLAFGDFQFSRVDSIRDPAFLPGAEKFGDVAGLLECITSH